MIIIIKLLKLKDLIIKEEYNIILIIVNRITRYFYIILFKKNIYCKVIKNYYT